MSVCGSDLPEMFTSRARLTLSAGLGTGTIVNLRH